MGLTSRLNFNGPSISGIRSSAFCIPAATPEADGTLAWTSTSPYFGGPLPKIHL
jgi:hypothetical protein